MRLKNITYITIILGCLASSVYLLFPVKSKTLDFEYTWHQSYLGGGGYITGLIQDPVNPDILYARCDVAGVFKSLDGGKNWASINNGMMQCHDHSVESFAISPANPNVLLRCSGEGRNHTLIGNIHKSVDGGLSWYKVSDSMDYAGNGSNRMMGEMVNFDPFNPAFVVAGSFSKGIFYSYDEGETWTYGGLQGEPIKSVVFHPTMKGYIYVGTLNHMRYKDYLFPDGSYKRENKGKLYVSKDNGKSWLLLYENEDIEFSEIAFDLSDPDIFYVASNGGGIYKTTDGGSTFNLAMEGLPKNVEYHTISTDPFTSGVVYTTPSRRGNHKDIPLVPLYKSVDYGKSWNLLKNYSKEDFKDYPEYIRTEEYIGWAISKFKPDLKVKDKLYMTNWYGVSVSEDGGKSWSGNNFKGLETLCAENIIGDKKSSNKFYFTVADHQPCVTTNNGRIYEHLPKLKDAAYLNNSTALEASKFKEGFMIYGVTNRGMKVGAIVRSRDGGNTVELIMELKRGLFVQAIKEDPFTPGVFYAYVDGNVEEGAGLYKTSDWGETWKLLNLKLPTYIKTLPHQKQWIESEVLSVVFSQTKNVCGTNQLLCLDPFKKDRIYLGEWTEGLFISDDGGENWENVCSKLPFKRDTASILNCINVDEEHPGVIYAGFIREGLWRSDNYGKTWNKIYPKEEMVFNASSVVVGGKDKNELYVACEPLYWSKCESAIIYSNDHGKTWNNVFDKRLGAIRWKGIAVNKQTGTIHGVTCGNGVFYAEREGKND